MVLTALPDLAAYNVRYWSMYVFKTLDACYLPHPQGLANVWAETQRAWTTLHVHTQNSPMHTQNLCVRYTIYIFEKYDWYRRQGSSPNLKNFLHHQFYQVRNNQNHAATLDFIILTYIHNIIVLLDRLHITSRKTNKSVITPNIIWRNESSVSNHI